MPGELIKRLLKIARKHQVPILEDNFVGDLAYEEQVPTLYSLDDGGTVIYQGTFSKALCPGLRLGWLIAPEPVMARLRLAKRASDLSTNSMSQVILAEYLRRGLYEQHLSSVVAAYRERLDVITEELTKQTSEWLTWKRPEGGMFIWTKLPPGYSSRELLSFAEREGVTFSPGDVFNVAGGRSEHLRLTFIQQNPERIKEGVSRLSKALRSYSSSRKKLQRPDGSYQVAEPSFI
jgi:DNA-binding transcriptional MocR family regulator